MEFRKKKLPWYILLLIIIFGLAMTILLIWKLFFIWLDKKLDFSKEKEPIEYIHQAAQIDTSTICELPKV